MKLMVFLKQRLSDVIIIAASKERIQQLFGISFYRNAIYLMLNCSILAILGFCFWVIAARLYPVESVGVSSAAISAMALVSLLSTLGMDYGLIRFLPTSGKKASGLINSCFTISSLVSIALSVIFLVGLHLWCPALLIVREHPIFFASFIVFTVASTLMTFVSRTFVAERRASFTLAQGIIFGLFRFIPLVLLATLFHTFGIFASWGIASSIAVIIGVLFFLPRVQADYYPLPMIRREIVQDISPFSLANYAANLLWAIPGLVLPLLIVNILGAESNAYFYIAWAVAGILFMVPMATSFSLFAEGSHDEEKLAVDIRRSLKLTLAILIPATAIVLLLGHKILLLFGATYSENATKLLRILAISALPLGINYVYFSIKRVEMRMKSVVGLATCIATTTLVLSYILLPRMGIIGAGVGWFVSQGIVTLMVGCNLWRRCFHT